MPDNTHPHQYAIVDVETTGGSFHRDKVIEIGIVLMEGSEITGTYQSLIHPERSVPYQITGLTGIHDEMLVNAPKFYEIAQEIVKLTEGRIFVAHNARFDYSFIKSEFEQLGFVYTRRILDTVKLSRMTFPGHRSYSLSNLIQRLGLPMENRHRALDDAHATALLFKLILESGTFVGTQDDYIRMAIKETRLPPTMTLQDILLLPASDGVYFFYNRETLIYVGKSKNIKSRIAQHFSDNSQKSSRLTNSTTRIEYEVCPNELAALLTESVYIKKFKPVHNKAQRNTSYPYLLCLKKNESEKCELIIRKVSEAPDEGTILKYFSHKRLAEHYIFNLLDKFISYLGTQKLTDKEVRLFIDLYCDLIWDADMTIIKSYNSHFTNFLMNETPVFEQDMVIIDELQSSNEFRWVALISDGRIYGHGQISIAEGIRNKDDIEAQLSPIEYTPELDLIVHNYLKKYPTKFKVIHFPIKQKK